VADIEILNSEARTLTIVGTGLLGASLGLALRQAGYEGHRIGVGRRVRTVEQAADLGCIDEATTDLAEAAARSRLLVLATPVGRFSSLLEQLAAVRNENLIITDVGSTKVQVCESAKRLLEAPQRFVGAHPMAGSEQSGPDAARGDLFAGKPCVICAASDADSDAVELVEALWSVVGMQIVHLAAQQHDRAVAAISHLPHVLSATLVQSVELLGGWELASTGFRDATRLASSNPAMRADIMISNRQEILCALDNFSGQLVALRRILAVGNEADLVPFLEQQKRLRDRWLKQKGEDFQGGRRHES